MKKILVFLTALFSVGLFVGCSKPQGTILAPSRLPQAKNVYSAEDWNVKSSKQRVVTATNSLDNRYYYNITVTWVDDTFTQDLELTYTFSGYLENDSKMHIVGRYLPNENSYIELGVGKKRVLLNETGPQVNYDAMCIKVNETSKIKVRSVVFNKVCSVY